MKKLECDKLINLYLNWLQKELSADSINENVCELTTPFLDRHNDHLQVYAVNKRGNIMLSDDGYIISDLRTSGFELNTTKRKETVNFIVRGFGVKLDKNQLVIEASEKNLGQRIHSLIQAMLAVNDMFVMSKPRVASFFWEDVQEYLDEYAVRYSPRVKLPGRSGFDQGIDFLIPKSKTKPERLVQAINAPNKYTISNYLWVLDDTLEIRGKDSIAYAFLNDTDKDIGGDVIEALKAYRVVAAPWSYRKQYVEQLAT